MTAVFASPALRMLRHPAALLGAALAAIAGLVQVPTVAVERCVDVPSGLSWLGVHLSLVREASTCSSGYATAPQGHVLGIVVMVTIPVLLANLLFATVAFGGLSVVAAMAQVVWTFAHAARIVLPKLRALPVIGQAVRGMWTTPRALASQVWGLAHGSRAPPAFLYA